MVDQEVILYSSPLYKLNRITPVYRSVKNNNTYMKEKTGKYKDKFQDTFTVYQTVLVVLCLIIFTSVGDGIFPVKDS